jgi:hypothetical protein
MTHRVNIIHSDCPKYAGRRSIVAIEHNFVPDLSNKLSRGCKVILQGPIRVQRGVLLLVPGNILVIGGEVHELDAQMKVLSAAAMQQPIGRRGPPLTLQQYNANVIHSIIETSGAAAVANRTHGGGGFNIPQGGRPVEPVSPEQQQQQQAPLAAQQRMPDSPRQLQQQQQQQFQQQNARVPTANGNMNGVFMPSYQQNQGSISFGSGNVPPVGAGAGAHQQQQQQRQQQPVPYQPPPNANGNLHAPPPLNGEAGEASGDGQGWPSDSEEEEDNGDDDDEADDGDDGIQPGAGIFATTTTAAPQQQRQQQQRQNHTNPQVIRLLDDEEDEETQPEELQGQLHILDSPRHEPQVTSENNNNDEINTGNNNGTTPRVPAANRDDIESSSQEDGNQIGLPWNSNPSSSGKKKKRKTDIDDLRRSASPQIMTGRGNGGGGVLLPPTEPQGAPFLENDGGDGAEGAGGGGGAGGNSSERKKKQRLLSGGQSNVTTNIVVNAAMGAVDASPRARTTLISDFDQVSDPNNNNDNYSHRHRHSPQLVPLPASAKIQPISDSLMAAPLGLDQIRAAGQDSFEFPQMRNNPLASTAPAVAPPAAAAPAAGALPPQQRQEERQQERNEILDNNDNASILEWGSQGPQPFTYLYHFAQHIAAVDGKHQNQQELVSDEYYPIYGTVQGSIARIIDTSLDTDPATGAKHIVVKVLVEDSTGTVEAILDEALVLDFINGILRNSGLQANSMDDVLNLKKQHPEVVKNAMAGLRPLLKEHYGLLELMVYGPGEYPQVVQLLGAHLTSSQLEMLRARVQRGGAGGRGGGGAGQ